MSGHRDLPEIIVYEGAEHTIYEWARITGFPLKVLRERQARNWSARDMLTIPPGVSRRTPHECRGCKYEGHLGATPCCDFLIMTGHARTVYRGQKVDLCPRKRRRIASDIRKNEAQENPEGMQDLPVLQDRIAVGDRHIQQK